VGLFLFFLFLFFLALNHGVQKFIDCAIRHVHLRQGVLGLKVKIMLPHDPTGRNGPKTALPDVVTIVEPKDETNPEAPYSEAKP
jgi:small subunit ribosomal protein S3e